MRGEGGGVLRRNVKVRSVKYQGDLTIYILEAPWQRRSVF